MIKSTNYIKLCQLAARAYLNTNPDQVGSIVKEMDDLFDTLNAEERQAINAKVGPVAQKEITPEEFFTDVFGHPPP